MPTESERDNTRTVVKTYIPAYQREEWDEHADRLDMSRSEFIRSMVQAGRSGFEATPRSESDPGAADQPEATEADETPDSHPDDLRTTVIESLSTDTYLDWDELRAAVTDDIDTRLEETLQHLQAADRVRYSGRHGGYTLEE